MSCSQCRCSHFLHLRVHKFVRVSLTNEPLCLQVVFEEAGERKIIFSTFDPDCATLARLKQPRYPVFFLTCAGEKVHCVEVLVWMQRSY